MTDYIVSHFSFCVIGTSDPASALRLERGAIGMVAMCPACQPSLAWLGSHSPVAAIRESGLWQVQHLRAGPLKAESMAELEALARPSE